MNLKPDLTVLTVKSLSPLPHHYSVIGSFRLYASATFELSAVLMWVSRMCMLTDSDKVIKCFIRIDLKFKLKRPHLVLAAHALYKFHKRAIITV